VKGVRPLSLKWHWFPADVIRRATWLYFRSPSASVMSRSCWRSGVSMPAARPYVAGRSSSVRRSRAPFSDSVGSGIQGQAMAVLSVQRRIVSTYQLASTRWRSV